MKLPLVQVLPSLIQQLQNHLSAFQTIQDRPPDPNHLEQATAILEQMLQTVTAFQQEFGLLCDLIICGNIMSDYLSSTQKVNKIMRDHASHWQKLVSCILGKKLL